MKASLSLRNGLLQSLGVRLNLGVVRFYNGTQPTDVDTALSGNTLIVECAIPSTAFSLAGGVLSLIIGAGTVASSGTPTFARFFQFGGTNAEFDMTVGADLVLAQDAWTAGEAFPAPSIRITLPVGT